MEFLVFSFQVGDVSHCGLKGRRARDPLVWLFPHFSLMKLKAQDSEPPTGEERREEREGLHAGAKLDGLHKFPVILCTCDLTFGLHQLESFLKGTGVLLHQVFCVEHALTEKSTTRGLWPSACLYFPSPGVSVRKKDHAQTCGHPI